LCHECPPELSQGEKNLRSSDVPKRSEQIVKRKGIPFQMKNLGAQQARAAEAELTMPTQSRYNERGRKREFMLCGEGSGTVTVDNGAIALTTRRA
jgi:hypothetical protein